jgi:hypothetical protein
MTPERWQRVGELFDSAVELEPARRKAFLAVACAGDQELHHEVAALLACDERGESFLKYPATGMPEPSAPVQLAPGEQLGPYRIIAPLGAGGMGEVYRAIDTRLQRNVAVKLLPRRFAEDAQALDRFQREARAASALNHPTICTIHDVGERDGQPFLVMELLEGQLLKERLAAGPVTVAELVALAIRMAGALEAAHSKGIVHRDIKPGNIYITGPGEAKILDFGLAKLLSEPAAVQEEATAPASGEATGSTGRVLGTVAYMSPEQARGEPVDQRTDLFSLGVTLYQMATGTLPFQGDTPALVRVAILTRQPARPRELNPAVPQELERVILKALEKDRTIRYQSAAELRVDLERLHPAQRFLAWKTLAVAGALVALIVTAVSIRYAGQRAPKLSTGPLACAESGAGQTYLKACAAPHGNLFSFESPRGKEHIRVGFWWEGYTVCYTDSTGRQSAYDVGQLASGWAEPHRVDGSSFPLKIYRKTLDGRIELVQEIARNGGERDVTITMTLYNRSPEVLADVVLDRYADLDIDNTWGNDSFVQNASGVTAREAGGGAVSMMNLTTGVPSEILVDNTDSWYDKQHYRGCQMAGNPASSGDNLGAIRFYLSGMNPSSSRTAKIVYRAW